jgi:iron donor protein CyaY
MQDISREVAFGMIRLLLSPEFAIRLKTPMIDEATFRRESDKALESLKQALISAEEEGGFEAEEKNGVLNVLFEDGSAKFVFTPNTPVRQVWISAQSTSFKLVWNEDRSNFVLTKTGEDLMKLTERLLREHLNDESIKLA